MHAIRGKAMFARVFQDTQSGFGGRFGVHVERWTGGSCIQCRCFLAGRDRDKPAFSGQDDGEQRFYCLLFSLLSRIFLTFVGMKIKLNWKYFLIFFVVIGGLYYITRSWLVTAGIMVLLLLVDGFLREYDNKKKAEKQLKDIQDKINRTEEADKAEE